MGGERGERRDMEVKYQVMVEDVQLMLKERGGEGRGGERGEGGREG